MINQSHEYTRSTSQSKRHNQPFIEPKLCFKSSFLFISNIHSNLMVTTSQIILENIIGPIKSSSMHVILPRNRMMITDNDVIYGFTIYTHPP